MVKRSSHRFSGSRTNGDWQEWENEATASNKRKTVAKSDTPAADAGEGIVIAVSRGRCTVAVGNEVVEVQLSPDLQKKEQAEPAVGDLVVLERLDEKHLRIREVRERHGVLSRPDPQNARREKVIAANIDVVVNVVTLREPPLAPRLIDRYLAASRRGGCELVVCINKIDLLTTEEREEGLARLATYRELGAALVTCSARSGEGLAELRRHIQGLTSALSGHSGVGKSSLINALSPQLRLKTNTLHKSGGTGRHTTSASTLYRLDETTSIIDTPGIREFGLWRLDRATLSASFDDFDEHNAGCRFNDCSHSHEPVCGVRQAVEAGNCSALRYQSYLRLLEELDKE